MTVLAPEWQFALGAAAGLVSSWAPRLLRPIALLVLVAFGAAMFIVIQRSGLPGLRDLLATSVREIQSLWIVLGALGIARLIGDLARPRQS